MMKTVGVSYDIKFYNMCNKLPPELVDHCAVGDVETFANLLQKKHCVECFRSCYLNQ